MQSTQVTSVGEWRTVDFGVASCLIASGFLLKRIEPVTHRQRAFVFDHSHEIAAVERGYWDGTHSVPALRYYQASKDLKSRLRAELL